MNDIGHDIIQQALVVRDDDRRVIGTLELGHAGGHDSQRIDIEAAVGLVEHGELRLEHRHLENLVLLFLAAREPFVHGPAGQLAVEFDDGGPLAHHPQEFGRRKRLEPLILALLVNGVLHEVGHADAGNLDRILKAEEQPGAGPLLDRHAEQIAPLEKNLALGHLEALVARQHRGQRALARAVRPHDRMDLAGTHRQIDSLQYLLAVDSGMQIFHFQHSIYLMRPARLALAHKPEAR